MRTTRNAVKILSAVKSVAGLARAEDAWRWRAATAGAMGGCLSLCVLLATGCAASLPKPITIAPASGLVYDALLSDSGLTLAKEGKIVAASPSWAKKALATVLDLQQQLDDCAVERRALTR